MWIRASLLLVASLVSGCASGEAPTDADIDESLLLSDLELNYAMRDCLNDAGFEATVEEDDAFGPTMVVPPQSNAEADRLLTEAQSDCVNELLADGRMSPTRLPSEDDLISQYTYLLTARECLIELGFSIQAPPSEGAYIADGGQWLPHNEVEGQASNFEEIEDAYRQCPQLPRQAG